MIILDSTLKSVEMVLAGAVTTTQWAFYTSYVDIPAAATSFTPGANDGVSNSTTNQTIVAAPGVSTARQVKMLSIANKDTALGTVTVQLNNNSTRTTLMKVPLNPGEELTFVDSAGWRIFDVNGNWKTIGTAGPAGPTGPYGGAVALDYLWDTGTSDADPGAGKIRGNNATTASITTLFIDLVDNNGQTQTSLIDTFDASTSTTKARIRLSKKTDVTKWMVFSMTVRTTATGYRKLTVAQVSQSGASPFINGDEILIDLDFTGDLGTTGSTGPTGPSGGTRETTIASSSTPTPNADTTDIYTVTALAAGATFGAPTGTPVQGQKLIIRIKDNGSAQTLAWNAIYRASSDMALPTTTVISKTMYCGFCYNATNTKWDFLAFLNNLT